MNFQTTTKPPLLVPAKDVQKNTQLNKTMALRETLPDDDPLIASLDARITELRREARETLPEHQKLDEAVQSLAIAQQKWNKSVKHLTVPQEIEEKNRAEVARCKQEMLLLQQSASSRPSVPLPPSASAARAMATTLESLKVGAHYTQSGHVAVDPHLLTTLAAQLKDFATSPATKVKDTVASAAKRHKTARPQEAEVLQIDISSPTHTAVTSDAYLLSPASRHAVAMGEATAAAMLVQLQEEEGLTMSDHSGVHHASKFRLSATTHRTKKKSHKKGKSCTEGSQPETTFVPIRRLVGKKPGDRLFSAKNHAALVAGTSTV